MMAQIRAKQRRVEIKNNERTGIKSPIQPLCERPTQKDASAECAAAAGTEGDGRWCFLFSSPMASLSSRNSYFKCTVEEQSVGQVPLLVQTHPSERHRL